MSELARAGGPLLFPGAPGIFDESCCLVASFCWLEPVVVPPWPSDFTAGPLLLPGKPGTPVPEFCPVGAADCDDGALVVCAAAGRTANESTAAALRILNMRTSLDFVAEETSQAHDPFPEASRRS